MKRKASQDELIERMATPEPLKSLRRQLEQIEREEQEAAERFMTGLAAEGIRQEIRRRGRAPCA